MSQIKTLLAIMEKLRDPESGCPWDLKQTYETIVPHTLEEVYEVIEAIENGTTNELCEELGDLLFQVVFYAQIAQERGDFNFADIVEGISEKLIRRHPHVFGDAEVDESELPAAWNAFKKEERKKKGKGSESLMDNLPQALPALVRARKIQNRAASVGFDWQTIEPVWEKLHEEIEEIHEAVNENMGLDRIEDEIGDLLCVCVNLSRHLGVDAEKALRRSNRKFERRFRYIESRLDEQGRTTEETTLEEMDALWDEAKRREGDG